VYARLRAHVSRTILAGISAAIGAPIPSLSTALSPTETFATRGREPPYSHHTASSARFRRIMAGSRRGMRAHTTPMTEMFLTDQICRTRLDATGGKADEPASASAYRPERAAWSNASPPTGLNYHRRLAALRITSARAPGPRYFPPCSRSVIFSRSRNAPRQLFPRRRPPLYPSAESLPPPRNFPLEQRSARPPAGSSNDKSTLPRFADDRPRWVRR